MSLNNTSQQDEAALPMPSLPPTVVTPPAVEQPVQLESMHLEEPPAAAAAPQADSINSPSPAPELNQPPPPPPPPPLHEPHPSGPSGPEPKVPAVLDWAWAPAHCFNCLSSRTCFLLALCMKRPHCVTHRSHRVPLAPREKVRPHAPQ